MELRLILYGYEMKNQTFKTVKDESVVVNEIFSRYISGETLNDIAEGLSKNEVPYYKEKKRWNKNMICRIIENANYIGNEEYEQIISNDTYQKAKQLKENKGGKRETDSEEVRFLKYHTVCSECGGRFTRRSKYKTREKWMCTCGCKTKIYIDDKFYFNQICSVINKVITTPELLKIEPIKETYSPKLEITRGENEIVRMLDQPEVEFQPVKHTIFDCVSSKFDCCIFDYSQEYTDLLMDYFRYHEKLNSIELTLLKQAVTRIAININGEISIAFVNGKEIKNEVEDTVDGRDSSNDTKGRNKN